MGGHKNFEIPGTAFYFLCLNLYTKKRKIIYSSCPATKQRPNDAMSVGHDEVQEDRHFYIICQLGSCQALNHKKY